MTETMKKLHEIIQTRADQPVISFRKEPPKKKVEPIYHNECNFGTKDHLGDNDETLFVRGFDTSLPRHEIKSALMKHFGSCGKVTRVYAPIECATGASLGFAFIDLKGQDYLKGLTLSGSDFGGRELYVVMAKHREEFGGYYNFIGCKRCLNYKPWVVERERRARLMDRYMYTRGERGGPLALPIARLVVLLPTFVGFTASIGRFTVTANICFSGTSFQSESLIA